MQKRTRSQEAITPPEEGTPAMPRSGAAGAERTVAPYDFRHPHRISKDRLRTIEAMYDRMARSLEGWLMGRVRSQIELSLDSVEQHGFHAYTASLPNPCSAYLYDIADSGGLQAVINLGTDLSAVLVDRFFGGVGDPIVPERALTPMERMAVRVVSDRMARLLSESWSEYVDLRLSLSSFESVPEIIRAMDAADSVLVATYSVRVCGLTSTLSVCIPFGVIDRFLQEAGTRRIASTSGTHEERLRSRMQAEAFLLHVKVPVSARLPDFSIGLGELTTLEVGMVLDTGIRCNSQILVSVRDQVRFNASAARVGAKMAVTVQGQAGDGPLSLHSIFPTQA